MDIIKFGIEKILYPMMEKRRGNHIRSNTQALLSGSVPSAEEKLGKLLLHCIEQVPAYAHLAHLKPQIAADPMAALRQFPLLSKSQYRQAQESYIAKNAAPGSMIPNNSGGSSGTPVQFYMDRYTVEWYEAARWRGLADYDISNGSRCLMIWGNPFELDRNEQLRFRLTERYLKNRRIIPAYALTAEKMPQYIKLMKSYHPEYLYGYAGALGMFARLMTNKNLSCPVKLKAIVSTSETLDDDTRAAIAAAFPHTPIVNEYGARDGGIIAYECPHHRLHLSSENLIAEILTYDLQHPAAPGERGLLAVTDLNNFVQPRLRYLLGDEAALLPADDGKPCPCGSDRPALLAVYGREDDIFRGMDGRFVHGVAFANRIKTLPEVEEFRVIQNSPEKVTVLLRTHNGAMPANMDALNADYQDLLPGTEFTFTLTDEIPPLPSGKKRYTIRNFSLLD